MPVDVACSDGHLKMFDVGRLKLHIVVFMKVDLPEQHASALIKDQEENRICRRQQLQCIKFRFAVPVPHLLPQEVEGPMDGQTSESAW